MADAQPAADPTTLDDLRRQVASATGAARAGVDLAEHGTRHTARQIVYALAQGAAENPELRTLLRELATESEQLSGAAVRLDSALGDAERTASVVADAGDSGQQVAALATLQAVHTDGAGLHAAADSVRRRLPRAYGDPLEVDPGWPAEENAADPELESPDEPDPWLLQLKATVAAALDASARERRARALQELVEFIEEAQGPATLKGGITTLFTFAYEIGFEDGRYGAPTDPEAGRSTPSASTPENALDRPYVDANGSDSSAEYLRTMMLMPLDIEAPGPHLATILEIAQLISGAAASTTLRGELDTVLTSAHKIGRRHGVDGVRRPLSW